MNHLIILPILWPLLVALLTMLPPFDQNLLLRRFLSVSGSAVLVVLSALLVIRVLKGLLNSINWATGLHLLVSACYWTR